MKAPDDIGGAQRKEHLVMYDQNALEAAAAYYRLTEDQAESLAIMLGEAYDSRFKRLYGSQYGEVTYGAAGVLYDRNRYSKSYHRQYGSAKTNTAGARFVLVEERLGIEFETVRGKICRAYVPTSAESLVFNPYNGTWISVTQAATAGKSAVGIKVVHGTNAPKAWWLDHDGGEHFLRLGLTGLQHGAATIRPAEVAERKEVA